MSYTIKQTDYGIKVCDGEQFGEFEQLLKYFRENFWGHRIPASYEGISSDEQEKLEEILHAEERRINRRMSVNQRVYCRE